MLYTSPIYTSQANPLAPTSFNLTSEKYDRNQKKKQNLYIISPLILKKRKGMNNRVL